MSPFVVHLLCGVSQPWRFLSSVIRPSLGLGVPPSFLSLDPFLEVICEAVFIFLAWGWGVDLSVWTNHLETSSVLLASKSSVCGLGFHIGRMRVTSLDRQEDTW